MIVYKEVGHLRVSIDPSEGSGDPLLVITHKDDERKNIAIYESQINEILDLIRKELDLYQESLRQLSGAEKSHGS